MNIITQNPFRILGLSGNSKERELQNQISILKRYSEIGKTKSFDYDFEFIGDFTRTAEDIQEASKKIEQAPKKLLYSLFWFIKNTSFDEIAFNNLKEKEIEKAIEIWNKTLKEEISTKNYSSYLNLSTLYIALSTIEEQIDLQKLQIGISLKGKLIHSESLKDFSKLVTGNGVAIDPVEISKKFVNEVIELLKPYLNKTNGISIKDLISLFNTFPSSIHKFISSKFTEEPISNIENNIEKTSRKRSNNPWSGSEYGESLYNLTNTDIATLKILIGTSNVQYQLLVDKVANEILQCSIDFYNERLENDSDDNFEQNLNEAYAVIKLAESIAVSSQVKDRVKENVKTLNEMKDRTIHQVIDLLLTVKHIYETNVIKIKEQVVKLYNEDTELRTGAKYINQTEIIKSINSNINWEKVKSSLEKLLTDKTLERIKNGDNDQIKNEFLELINWLDIYAPKNDFISRFKKKYYEIPPMLFFKILSSKVSNTNNKPLYSKCIEDIKIQLNIEVLKSQKVKFDIRHSHVKSNIEGLYYNLIKNNFLWRDNNFDSSVDSLKPKTVESYFSFLDDNEETLIKWKNKRKNIIINITKDIRQINFSILNFYGNVSKTTGEHIIEVYVDEYLIHSIKYTVNMAPSELIEMQLKDVEEKLAKIKKTEYYKSEIQNATIEMSKIKKFKFFRSGTNKQVQISEQQRKIDDLHQKAITEKAMLVEQQNKIIYKLRSDLQNSEY